MLQHLPLIKSLQYCICCLLLLRPVKVEAPPSLSKCSKCDLSLQTQMCNHHILKCSFNELNSSSKPLHRHISEEFNTRQSWGPICQGLCKGRRNIKTQGRLPPCPPHCPITGHQSHQGMLWPLWSQQYDSSRPGLSNSQLLATFETWEFSCESPSAWTWLPQTRPRAIYSGPAAPFVKPGIRGPCPNWLDLQVSLLHRLKELSPKISSPQSLQGITSSQAYLRLLHRQKGFGHQDAYTLSPAKTLAYCKEKGKT